MILDGKLHYLVLSRKKSSTVFDVSWIMGFMGSCDAQSFICSFLGNVYLKITVELPQHAPIDDSNMYLNMFDFGYMV